MPLYIGDYLADTMHLTTQQHGAYLLLIFHLWRRGTLPDDDTLLGKIAGLAGAEWLAIRGVLAEFFLIRDGLWTHKRVDRERLRIEARCGANQKRAKKAAAGRWAPAADASSMPDALLEESKSQSQSESQSEEERKDLVSSKRVADPRHNLFRQALAEYWQRMNAASPEMPWQGRDAKALSDFLAACPLLSETQFRQMLGNRARSAVAHGDRVYLWIANLTRFQEEMSVYNKPVAAGGGYASRADTNRDAVFHAVDQALAVARSLAGSAGDPGAELAGFAGSGVPAGDGTGPGGRAVGVAGSGYRGLAAGDVAHGPAGRDGPVPYGATATVTSRVAAAGR